MILSVHQPQYIPWLGYFDKIAKSDCFVFLDKVQYKPREFQNRNKIRTKDGWIWLSVPVVSKGLGRQKISDVKIDNQFDWRRKHRGSLQASYSGCDFFDNYFPFFDDVYSRDWEKLIDLNIHITKFLLESFDIKTPIYNESDIGTTKQATDRIIEICKKLNADVYLSGTGGKDYLEEEKFGQAGIKLEYQDFKHPLYCQQFAESEDSFIPYMSAIDLLFNEGPESKKILKGGDRQ